MDRSKWRVGSPHDIHVYAERNIPIATAMTSEAAHQIAEEHNQNLKGAMAMYEVVMCDDKRITLRYILQNNDPEPPATVSFSIDNADNAFQIGDTVALKIRTVHLCQQCRQTEADEYFLNLSLWLCDKCKLSRDDL